MAKIVDLLCQVWFGTTLATWLIIMWTICQVMYLIPGTKLAKQKRCIVTANWCFYLMFFFTPWIRVKGADNKEQWDKMRKALKEGKSLFIMLNHTSFLDAILFSAFVPTDIILHLRTLLKASLCKIPLFGDVVNKCGHFPVHFTSQKMGSFSTDKKAMSDVMEGVTSHVNNGGSIVFFPEGQIGKDPINIQSFRRGSFQMAIDNKMEIFQMVMVGNEFSWPRKAVIGGLPGQIDCSVTHVSYSSEMDKIKLSEHAQKAMQDSYTSIYQTQPGSKKQN